MKVKTGDLSGQALDWAVAKIDGDSFGVPGKDYSPSADWAQGGPIIEREKITVAPGFDWHYSARFRALAGKYAGLENPSAFWVCGYTLLEAAMRCYVVSRLGNEIEIPDELIRQNTEK